MDISVVAGRYEGFFFDWVGDTHAEIFADGSLVEVYVLRHEAEGRAVRFDVEVGDRDAVDQEGARDYVVKTFQ